MKKLIVIRTFHDQKEDVLRVKGDEFEADEARSMVFVAKNVAEVIGEGLETPVEEVPEVVETPVEEVKNASYEPQIKQELDEEVETTAKKQTTAKK